MKFLDVNNWERKQHFNFFNTFKDPYFAITGTLDVTNAKKYAKVNEVSFFAIYLHACMQAINEIENFKYRITEDNKVVVHDTIHASATILRPNKTFGFSFINYEKEALSFERNYKLEKERICNSNALFPPVNTEDCIYCSALPWVNFTGHKEPVSGAKESVPKLAFGKVLDTNGILEMPIAISVNHALVDGYHVGSFLEKAQFFLNEYK